MSSSGSVEESSETRLTYATVDIVSVVCLSGLLIFFLFMLLRMSFKFQQSIEGRVQRARYKRKHENDGFRSDNGYGWDYVIVFKVYQEDEGLTEFQRKYSMKYVLESLTQAGLSIRSFYSIKRNEVFVKIRADLIRLQNEANRIDMKLLLDPDRLQNLCCRGREGKWTALTIPFPHKDKGKISIQDVPAGNIKYTRETDMQPYDHMYIRYDERPDLRALYKRYTTNEDTGAENFGPLMNEKSIFRGVDRLKLIHSIIISNDKSCARIDIYKLLEEECVLAYYPLHDIIELGRLEKKWLLLCQCPGNQDVDAVKDYFGEKIGLYFLWVGHYTSWLAVAALFGFAVWINRISETNNSTPQSMPYFAAFICIWSSFYLEYWKRKEKTYAMKWGMIGFEEEEQVRPQFKGIKTISPINGSPLLYFPSYQRGRRVAMTTSITFGSILVVIGAVACIFALKIIMSMNKHFQISGMQLGNIISGVINALQILFCNSFYGDMALKLNQYENHRTDTEFEDALIAKTFTFQFVNSFTSMFYIAFMKPYATATSDQCIGSCMSELQTAVGAVFLTLLTVGNIVEIGIPTLRSWFQGQFLLRDVSSSQNKKSESLIDSHDTDMSEVESVFLLPEYHVILGPFDDYAELVVQLGFTTMFVAAFPLALVLSFVNNYVEIRVDGWKLCEMCRRPEPRSCEDIGTWYDILETISIISVFTNSAIVAYTGGTLDNYTWTTRAWIFFSMSFGIMLAKSFVAYLIPDISSDVMIQIKRQELVTDTVVNLVDYNDSDDDKEDDDSDPDAARKKRTAVPPTFMIQDFDEDPL